MANSSKTKTYKRNLSKDQQHLVVILLALCASIYVQARNIDFIAKPRKLFDYHLYYKVDY